MKETKDSSQRLNKAEKSWILYDVANSAFIMIVTAAPPPPPSGAAQPAFPS